MGYSECHKNNKFFKYIVDFVWISVLVTLAIILLSYLFSRNIQINEIIAFIIMYYIGYEWGVFDTTENPIIIFTKIIIISFIGALIISIPIKIE